MKRLWLGLALAAALVDPGLAKETYLMVDRPGELLELAEQLAVNIQTAESIRDDILAEIEIRAERLEEVDRKLKGPSLSRGKMLELKAQRNQLEREENRYRIQALGVVKEQMDNVFGSLEKMHGKLHDLRSKEIAVSPEVVHVFNRYFKVSADIIKNSTNGLRGADPKAVEMMETLEKSLMVSQKSTDFLIRASSRIREYQKVVALYMGKLSYLEKGLEKHRNSLDHEKDAITITTSLETAEQFMTGLDMDQMEEAFMYGLSRDPGEFFFGDGWSDFSDWENTQMKQGFKSRLQEGEMKWERTQY